MSILSLTFVKKGGGADCGLPRKWELTFPGRFCKLSLSMWVRVLSTKTVILAGSDAHDSAHPHSNACAYDMAVALPALQRFIKKCSVQQIRYHANHSVTSSSTQATRRKCPLNSRGNIIRHIKQIRGVLQAL